MRGSCSQDCFFRSSRSPPRDHPRGSVAFALRFPSNPAVISAGSGRRNDPLATRKVSDPIVPEPLAFTIHRVILNIRQDRSDIQSSSWEKVIFSVQIRANAKRDPPMPTGSKGLFCKRCGRPTSLPAAWPACHAWRPAPHPERRPSTLPAPWSSGSPSTHARPRPSGL